VLKQALLKVNGPTLLPASIPETLSTPGARAAAPPSAREAHTIDDFLHQRLQDCKENLYHDVHRQIDRLLLPLVLQSSGGSQLRAARLLGITRRTLRVKLRELGLSVTKTIEGAESDDAD
jgi:DNA-binding protein Fis